MAKLIRRIIQKISCEIVATAMVIKCILNKNIVMGHHVLFRGWPIINTENSGSIRIGNNVKIDSKNRGYHINMHSPTKIFADRPGALVEIGDETCIHGSCLHAHKLIRIGKRCLIAANCQLFDDSGHQASFRDVENRRFSEGVPKAIVVEDYVWIGANCIILPGTHIGYGSIIGAGSVVSGTIPPMVIAAGNPAVVIKKNASPEN